MQGKVRQSYCYGVGSTMPYMPHHGEAMEVEVESTERKQCGQAREGHARKGKHTKRNQDEARAMPRTCNVMSGEGGERRREGNEGTIRYGEGV